MAGADRMTIEEVVRKVLLDEHADVIREAVKAVKAVAAELMELEVSELIGAERGERRPQDRATHRNGYRPRRWDTRAGDLRSLVACGLVGVQLAISDAHPGLKAIGRRTDVVGILPDDPSLIRLVSMLAIEANDEWLVGRSYISQGSMATLYETRTDRTLSPKTDEEVAELAVA
jgi:transposase-like protein